MRYKTFYFVTRFDLDQDIILKLQAQDNITTYITDLVKNDVTTNGLDDCKLAIANVYVGIKINTFIKSSLKYFYFHPKDSDVINKLNNQSNMSGYVRKLIKDDINKNGPF